MCDMYVGVYMSAKEGIGSPEAGVMGSCDLPNMAAKNNSGSLQEQQCSSPLSQLTSLKTACCNCF